jgi:outer membrane protein OmpA-like peptidoglycan-associated protein
VKRFLVNNYNLSPLQVQVKAYGESRPLFPEAPPEVRAKNRRVSFKLLPPNAQPLP